MAGFTLRKEKMRYRCLCKNERTVRRLFLELPKALYKAEMLPQDIKCERQLLEGRHILSAELEVRPFVVVDEEGAAVCRCLLTLYPDDETAYVGFFESFNCIEACRLMFLNVERTAGLCKKKRLAGPVNASIWLGYRFKTNKFEAVYTGEPYNREYYARLWQECGYSVCDRYFSNGFGKIREEDRRERFAKRLERFMAEGYVFKTLKHRAFDTALKEIYELMIRLYSGFPCYRYITYGQFKALFGGLKYIVDPGMVKLVYREQELAAFFICVPNYGALTGGRMSLGKLMNILQIRRSPGEYVLLYMGVRPDCLGLGSALSELVRDELCKSRCSSIGALIHEGKITGAYYQELAVSRYEYVLLDKNLCRKGAEEQS